ncbi:hypothetical protein ACFCZT_20740 [Streptomyces sp. NPDC056230]|uniref:hypothetical protein n=1 Tax=Streptomyces sp. NPDC056230 TaxID=3345754 RepID=UPI0035E0A0E1
MRATSGDRPTASGVRAAAAATAAVAAAVSLVLITGCGKVADHRASDTGSSSPTASPTPSANPSYGTEYLAENECAAPVPGQPEAYREVSCKDPEAVAKVIDRADIGISEPFSATACSPHTDFAINVPVSLALLEDRRVTGEGYACMRNLKPPHPGDTGGGGGPRIEVGDCVHSGPKKDDAIKEVACRTKGKKDGATHKITEILEDTFAFGFNDPCEGKADAIFTENPLFDPAPAKNDRVLCAKKL